MKTAEKEKINNLYGLIHPFYGFDIARSNKKYSEKEAKEMMQRYKNLVDRIAWDKNAALIIDPSKSKKEKELFEYAIKKIPKERLIFDRKNSIEEVKNTHKQKEKLREKIDKKANLLLCGEKTEACVINQGFFLMDEMKILKKNVIIMPDISVTWKEKGESRIPITPSKLKKMTIKEKEKILKEIKKEAVRSNLHLPQTRQQQEKLDELRGFSTLPKNKLRRRRK